MKSAFLLFYTIITLSSINVFAQKTLLFIGDSFTAGDGVEKNKTFPSLVGQQMTDANAINQGRSGWPTSAYLRRWGEVTESLPESAEVIFIQLGANDLRVDGHSQETIEQCAQNMEVIVGRIQELLPQAKIVLMSSVKIDENQLIDKIREAGFGKHSNKYLRQIGKSYKKLAKIKGFDYIDLIAKLPKRNTHDGAHLNEAAHEIVAAVILKYLKNNGFSQ